MLWLCSTRDTFDDRDTWYVFLNVYTVSTQENTLENCVMCTWNKTVFSKEIYICSIYLITGQCQIIGYLFTYIMLNVISLKTLDMLKVVLLSQVNIRVSVIDGVVHVNNSKAIHQAVTTFHFFAEIGKKLFSVAVAQYQLNTLSFLSYSLKVSSPSENITTNTLHVE